MRILPVLAVLLLATPAAAQEPFASRVLDAHNSERAAVGTAPLTWSEPLERDAQAWAETLARKGGGLEHADQRGQGENLWMGPANAYSVEQMVAGWAAEKRYYSPGVFADVVQSGNVVGHYTQIVWRSTTEVGCAVARAAENEVLVCRYGPPGNYIGKTAY
ncbi:MAG: SCP-like extracellular [Caulobacteraceae bacterium]|nr:CAP family protein [Caulobacter sp.]RYF92144.1 MAG: SCP-like extracellular [Caulobacteraceae bacterium]